MKHWTMLVTIALLFSGVSLAQELAARPAPSTGDGILGPQLIAWSEMQKPQPVPQRPQPVPVPDSNTDKQAGPTEDTPQQPPAQDAKAPAQEKQGPAALTLTGTVIKLGNKYVLKTIDKQTYELDDQNRAREYEGKQVKIVGSLDRTTNRIHITSIELVS
jgi:Protein of unknown function (DUF5818)